jgi:conserved oligomeric Golgi complex subunit 6
MTVYESSLSGEETLEERDSGFRRILDVMVDPAVEICGAAAEEKKRLRYGWDKEVFVLNCLTYLQVCFPSIW